MIYAYCRVSTQHQKLARQITNITALYPTATIIKEFYTGTKQDRPNWNKLIGQIKTADTIVFDSVSRMSRNANEGFKDYKMLYESGVNLVFLNEPLINTSVFDSTKNNLLSIDIATGNAAVDTFFKGNIELINNFMMALAEEQIKAAFDQAEKEVTDLHSRISQGIREAKKNGTKIGLSKGTTLITKKSIECKAIIKLLISSILPLKKVSTAALPVVISILRRLFLVESKTEVLINGSFRNMRLTPLS